MANSGVNKFQVQKARDALVARGVHPSIDAVRIELGNTGSKATIHRYLKELAEEQPSHSGRKIAISETLTTLVEQLANQSKVVASFISLLIASPPHPPIRPIIPATILVNNFLAFIIKSPTMIFNNAWGIAEIFYGCVKTAGHMQVLIRG